MIQVEDTLDDMDKVLEQLVGHGHVSGDFIKLDNIFEVIYRNSHKYYSGKSEKNAVVFTDFNEPEYNSQGEGQIF